MSVKATVPLRVPIVTIQMGTSHARIAFIKLATLEKVTFQKKSPDLMVYTKANTVNSILLPGHGKLADGIYWKG